MASIHIYAPISDTLDRAQNYLPCARKHCYIAFQWLAHRGQIFARCSKIPAQRPGLSNKPGKARCSPPLFLSRWAIHVYPNIHCPEEQNSPFHFSCPPVWKGGRSQVSHAKSLQRAAQQSHGDTMPMSPALCAGIGRGHSPLGHLRDNAPRAGS